MWYDCTNGTGLQSALSMHVPGIIRMSLIVTREPTREGPVADRRRTYCWPVYWLMIDGVNGAACKYTITVAEGIEAPGLAGIP
jgi:hypothetical protein